MEALSGSRTGPGVRFAAALVFALVVSLVATLVACSLPRSGASFGVDGGRLLVSPPGSSEVHPVVRIGSGGDLPAEDMLAAEPDVLPDYARVDRAFAAHGRLAASIAAGPVVVYVGADGERTLPIENGTRPADLPAGFWKQLAIGFAGFMVSAWAWSVRPRALPTLLFGATGVAMLAFVDSAAIYTTRELAIPAGLFRGLHALNHVGASMFGTAMAAMFLVYPRRLVDGRVLVAMGGVFFLWLVADQLRWVPSPAMGGQLATTVQMLVILVAIGWQFVATAGDPVGRAALRWVGVSTLLGAGLFIATSVVPTVVGLPPVVDQGTSFAFFLIIHVGTAVGLGRERLFAVEPWATGLLLYGSIGVLFLLVDVALVMLLGSVPEAGAATALLLLPLLYLPLRDRLARRFTGSGGGAETFEAVARMALARSLPERERLWRQVLDGAFAPLRIVPDIADGTGASIAAAGNGMLVPAAAGAPALRLDLARRGTRLFQRSDLELADRMVEMADRVDAERRSYERGISEERVRVSRDLHDDLAARLMSGLSHDDPERLRRSIREALAEVRTIVSADAGRRARIVDVLADARSEIAERLDAAGMTLDWTPQVIEGGLDAATVKALTSSLRELATNVLRHSGATSVTVAAAETGDGFEIVFEDDGGGLAVGAEPGNGLRNIEERLRSVGGGVCFHSGGAGFRAALAIPTSSGDAC